MKHRDTGWAVAFPQSAVPSELDKLDERRRGYVRATFGFLLFLAAMGFQLFGLRGAWGVAVCLGLWIWYYSGFPFEQLPSPYFRERGYDKIRRNQWRGLERSFGFEALRTLPTWDELRLLPEVDPERQYESVFEVLQAVCLGPEPRHFPLTRLGYRELTTAQMEALVQEYGEELIAQMPTAEESEERRRQWWLGQFDYVSKWLEERSGRPLPNRKALRRAA